MTKKILLFVLAIIILIICNLLLGPAGTTSQKTILIDVRLPRILMALMAGACLAVSGAAIQSLLRNPLAEPGLLGVSSWAALGSIIILYFSNNNSNLWLPLGGLAGALLSIFLLFILSGYSRSVLTVVLAGLASSSLAGALISLSLNLAPNPWVLGEMVEWLFGSLRRADNMQFFYALPFALTGLILLFSCRKQLYVLSLGEAVASSLGIHLKGLYIKLAIGIALCVGVVTAFCGVIGFIGLMIPHMVRPMAAHRPNFVMIYSFFAGMVMMLAADLLVRILPTRNELYIGVVMALLGFPFFLYIILRQRIGQS